MKIEYSVEVTVKTGNNGLNPYSNGMKIECTDYEAKKIVPSS